MRCFDARRVFCLLWLWLDVICMDRDWIINAAKPTLSPHCNLCKSHHLSDEFSKRGTSPVPNRSVSRLVIGLTKIAMFIWQLGFDLRYDTEAGVPQLSSPQRSFIKHCSARTMCFLFKWIHLISGAWCCRKWPYFSEPLFTVQHFITSGFWMNVDKLELKQLANC